MSAELFPHLLSPLKLGPVTLRNRTVFTGHDTLLQSHDGQISDAYIAYQVARAKGGAGLLVLGASAIDENAAPTSHQLRLDSDDLIPGYRRMAEAVHAHAGVVFAQLLHAGREVFSSDDGSLAVAYSASATTQERFNVLPRAMSKAMIGDVIAAFAAAAARAQAAGLDGVELVANQGNLPAQFLSANINRRTDEYGGSLENRIRFTLEAARAIRAAVGPAYAFGVRLSADEFDTGVTEEESLALARALDQEDGLVDFLSIVVGGGGTRASAAHIVAPMSERAGYVTPYARRIKQAVRAPIIATGRFNTPQDAEAAIQSGAADACGMTRAMITDPELGNKVREGRPDDVRACIGCDQACIGHYFNGFPVSCIQYPESGRELTYGVYLPAARRKRVLVAGGGPAGMKAAVVAARRGHEVVLCEAEARLGGQALLAQLLPTRAEFGGVVTNLERELELTGVEVRRGARVDRALIENLKPDAVVIATGGRTALPDPENLVGVQVVTADDILRGRATPGQRVVIADSRCDWVGIGMAEMLVAQGHHVRLAVNNAQPGAYIPMYLRDLAAGRLHRAGVEVSTYARLFGADGDTVYFQHIMAPDQPIVMEGVDTLVISFGQVANLDLQDSLDTMEIERHVIGDCMTPRTAEEAILEGLKVGFRL